MRDIENELKEKYGIDYRPLTETDEERKRRCCLAQYEFPEYVFGALWVLLLVIWVKIC